MCDVRLGDDKVAVDDAQLGAVLERLAVEAQLIQKAPAPDERRKKTPVKHAGGARSHFTSAFELICGTIVIVILKADQGDNVG